MSENEIVKQQAGAIVPFSDPQFTGLQEVEASDTVRLPRLVMAQSNGKMVQDRLAMPGDFVNTLTKQPYGPELKIVPLFQRKNTRIRWIPRSAGGGIQCINRNRELRPAGDPGDKVGNCASCEFFQNYDDKLGCTDNYEIVALVVTGPDANYWEPVLIAAQTTKSSDAGIRDMLGIARLRAPAIKLFQMMFSLSAPMTTNSKGSFFKITCRQANEGKPLAANVQEIVNQKLAFYLGAKITADHADAEEAAAVPVSSDDSPPNKW